MANLNGTGRTVLVTGARGGIIGGVLPALVNAGYKLVLTDRLPCTDVAATYSAATVYHATCDLESAESVGEFLENASGAADIDIVINNAAFMQVCPVETLTSDIMARFHRVNVEAPMQIATTLAPAMAKRGFGRIVNVVSGTPWFPSPGMTPYLTSKMGLIGLTRGLACDYGGLGITVNAITPALVRHENNHDGLPEEIWSSIPMMQAIKRPAQPEDIAGGILFLISDGAAFMTGQTIAIDGGMVLR